MLSAVPAGCHLIFCVSRIFRWWRLWPSCTHWRSGVCQVILYACRCCWLWAFLCCYRQAIGWGVQDHSHVWQNYCGIWQAVLWRKVHSSLVHDTFNISSQRQSCVHLCRYHLLPFRWGLHSRPLIALCSRRNSHTGNLQSKLGDTRQSALSFREHSQFCESCKRLVNWGRTFLFYLIAMQKFWLPLSSFAAQQCLCQHHCSHALVNFNPERSL